MAGQPGTLSEEAVDELYEWVNTVPFSREKEDIASDFSDGVMMAETVAYFLPNMIDIDKYVSTNAAEQKKINWNTLNRRVFSVMGISVGDATIKILIDGKNEDWLEMVLWELRRRIPMQPDLEPQPDDVTFLLAAARKYFI